jgi:hypothetical protein
LNTAVIAAAGITALAIFCSLAEWEGLTEGHAQPVTQIMNAARWSLVIALAWVLIPVAFAESPAERAATTLGLAALIGALMLVPVRWFVQIGGRDPIWEARRGRVEATQLTNELRRDPSSVTVDGSSRLIARLERSRSPETAELCDLLAAEVEDVLAGSELWNEAGRRTIRIDELCRRLWPDDMPLPDFSPAEATFRWHLYRTFGELMDLGAANPEPAAQRDLRRLLRSLSRFRRSDTRAFIHDVRFSALGWLAQQPSGRRWMEGYDFSVLGPGGIDKVKALWAHDSALWGAELDEDDRLALQGDRSRRRSRVQAA